MLWLRKRHKDPEIAPDEIFLDSSNTPDFDRSRFEGRIEKPLASRTFVYLFGTLALLILVLVGRSWNLQVMKGYAFAAQSAENSLKVTTVFAPRGTITDMYGTILADNVAKEGGTMIRQYYYPSLSQVIGYVSYPKKDSNGFYYDTEETGVTGLEAKYDSLLVGRNGQLLTETDAVGRVRSEGSYVPPIDGGTLELSIDASLQAQFAKAIGETAQAHHFIAGSGVIMDVDTGAVRALVSYPSYDANVMSNGTPAETIAAYNSDPGHPFLDHAVQGVYVPGSIVKPIVAAGALNDGIITEDTVINDPGVITVQDPYNKDREFRYTGWKALGPVDVKKAIAWSSDIFFYTVGGGFKSQRGLGIDRLAYWYTQFGLGSPTGIDLGGEANGLVPTPAWKKKTFNEQWYTGDTYFTAIGQYSMQVTPIQMARATAAVANGGKLYTPTLVANKSSAFTTVPVDQNALAISRAGMRQSVTSALANALNFPYVSVAAKTGTAQTGTNNQFDNSWVVGFFPYDHPQYAFAVVLERGPSGAGEQSVNAMKQLFESLHSQNSIYTGGTATSSTSF
ncbi:MAG: penicillin-binding protein 2, penicillin-binding protein 2 [Parcubacteria group bacterium]|nr:penicillin-binding protein 2, penicillin-binding protein 2 [Parcubacteria group bacterium]